MTAPFAPLRHPSATRTQAHAAIRAQGFGDKLDRLIALLAEHRAAFEEVVRLADTPATGATRFILGTLGDTARAGLRQIERTLDNPGISASPYGSLGDWGPNGHAPRIASLLSSARRQACGGTGFVEREREVV